MKVEHLKRMERLEAHQDPRPEMVVLVARDGQEDAIIDQYRLRTRPEEQAQLVVCVKRFT